MPLPTNRRRANLDFLNCAVEAGAIVHYQAGWSREVGLDGLLGYVHTVNVCNDNFHLHRFQPRRNVSMPPLMPFPEPEPNWKGD